MRRLMVVVSAVLFVSVLALSSSTLRQARACCGTPVCNLIETQPADVDGYDFIAHLAMDWCLTAEPTLAWIEVIPETTVRIENGDEGIEYSPSLFDPTSCDSDQAITATGRKTDLGQSSFFYSSAGVTSGWPDTDTDTLQVEIE